MLNKDNMYILTRQELKNSCADNFKEGDVVVCGNYFIDIMYGDYEHANMMTKLTTRYDLRYLKMSSHPQYIRNFIEKRVN